MMELIVAIPSNNLDPITLIHIFVIMAPVFTVFIFSFPQAVFNCGITELDQIRKCDSPLSEYHYRGDNKEHEYKKRIDRKSSLVYSIHF